MKPDQARSHRAGGHRHRPARRGQVAVMDRGIAAVLGAAALLGILGTYLFTLRDTSADQQANQIDAIAAEVTRLYAGRRDLYLGLTDTVVAATGSMPKLWLDPTQTNLLSIYHTPIKIEAVDNAINGLVNGAYKITLHGIPAYTCAVLGTTAYTTNMLGLTVDTNTLGTPQNPQGDPAAVAQACNASATSGTVGTMTFTFY